LWARQAESSTALLLILLQASLHARQELRFFHGYCSHYWHLALYIFCGEFLLCARLRSSNLDASAGSVEEPKRVVRQIRAPWPSVQRVSTKMRLSFSKAR